ncbi:MAG TPA: hypothetical protein VG796_20745 [Verrucomicrobiales bacterium]|nr:hypothetical protein [Verrucomicrobiales bacterium]
MRILPLLAGFAAILTGPAIAGEIPRYVPATAYYILPETTSEESGYFSLSESLDGKIHVGSAKYQVNSYLVEFDPASGSQRIVLDTNKTCGLDAKGYAAQAKLHTRNFVGPGGRVYVGSKQGYPVKGDNSPYPGGYAMTYDPRTGKCENLGMPFPGQGVIDTVADEARGLLYTVSCEDQHWMLGTLKGPPWKELGPLLTRYATTLVDSRGIAGAVTKEFGIAQYDPATQKVTNRPVLVDGQPWKQPAGDSIPCWQLDPDGRHAWAILLNDPSLIRIDLHSQGDNVTAENRGRMIEGKGYDSRGALTIHPDGKIYALVRIDNTTGFGEGYLHHLVRYDPVAKRHEDLGVLKVQNPDYYDPMGPDGKPKHHSHGFHRLPDGTLTPMHAHMALMAAHDGTLYATIIYPFTLLRIEGFKMPAPAGPAERYLDALTVELYAAAKRQPEITALAEKLAERYTKGGLIGFASTGSTLETELYGRSGGLMHTGFDRPWKNERTEEEKKLDVIIYSWDAPPQSGDLDRIKADKAKGLFVLGFGPKKMAALAPHIAVCDAWVNNGGGETDAAVDTGGRRAGRMNHFTNAVNGWLVIGEMVGALTRQGKMPTIWKNWFANQSQEWTDKYYGKVQFHDDFKVPPQPAGDLAKRYLERLRYMVARLKNTEAATLKKMAERIDTELRAGRKTMVASCGHMPVNYVGKYDDALWAENHEVHDNEKTQIEDWQNKTADDALVLRPGDFGLHRSIHDLFQKKKQRVMLITAENPRPDYAVPPGYELRADCGAAFGDACVFLEGYPVGILPPSGVMQIAAYETINVELQARQAK